MAEELRNWFNEDFYKTFTARLYDAYPKFETEKFIIDAMQNIDELGLMERMHQLTKTMHGVLPSNYAATLEILYPLVIPYNMSFVSMVFPDYVGRYGRDHYDKSIAALKHFTRYSSSEFAIREFLKIDFEQTLSIMTEWALDENEHVRRLASEGSRPRLPWSFKLPALIEDPTPARALLEKLKTDDALYVRKSVANHLNDITKDNPEMMLDWVGQWDRSNPSCAWIVKHASRSLLKQGHPRAFCLFDFELDVAISVDNLTLDKQSIQLGEQVEFSFDLSSKKSTPQKLAVDYRVHYVKKSGKQVPKVFKLKELSLKPADTVHISKNQQFKDFTTRKHYSGIHKIEIMVNGKCMGMIDLDLNI